MTDNLTIKLLPLDQPWASLIALGAEWGYTFKEFETRPRSAAPGRSYRGWVAIHANAKKSPIYRDVFWAIGQHLKAIDEAELAQKLESYFYLDKAPLGCIVALAQVTDALVMESRPKIAEYALKNGQENCRFHDQGKPPTIIIETVSKLERLTGDWQPGRWAFRLADVIALPEPIPFKGQQGAPEIKDEAALAKLRAAIEERGLVNA